MSTYQLRQAVWEITLACCFSCRYCGSGGGNLFEAPYCAKEIVVCGKEEGFEKV